MVTAKKKFKFDPDYAIPPGATLRDFMESMRMTEKDIASRIGITVQSLIRIFQGKQPITYDTANKLELVTSIPASLWNNLEVQFRAQLAKIKNDEKIKTGLEWVKTIPVKELIERKVLEPQDNKVELLRAMLKFFRVSSVDAWKELWTSPLVATKRSKCFETKPGPAATWIRLGEIAAEEIESKPYNRKKFIQALSEIRTLTIKDPKVFLPEMVSLCAYAGVALAIIPEMKKVPWSGATKWLTADKAMIIINIRGKTEDKFWFSFFHEAGHVLNDDSHEDPIEKKADEFAANSLIPRMWDRKISSLVSHEDVEALANSLSISPGIVVGRFQHLTGKWNFFYRLKRKFKWVEDKRE